MGETLEHIIEAVRVLERAFKEAAGSTTISWLRCALQTCMYELIFARKILEKTLARVRKLEKLEEAVEAEEERVKQAKMN
ncbi:MAG: hypothetical protein JRJ12_15530 [Deltaproteobacteria bacterium]|nr:hypothetical protein [Deltaproteobacteria bacterium]